MFAYTSTFISGGFRWSKTSNSMSFGVRRFIIILSNCIEFNLIPAFAGPAIILSSPLPQAFLVAFYSWVLINILKEFLLSTILAIWLAHINLLDLITLRMFTNYGIPRYDLLILLLCLLILIFAPGSCFQKYKSETKNQGH